MTKPSPKHLVYLVMLLFIILFRYLNAPKSDANVNDKTEIIEQLQSKRLIYTRHAECRMNCRFINESEIKAALRTGRINYHKSQPNDQPCPTYAIEDNTQDGQRVRIIFANCDDVVKVVTAIDLNRAHKCDCR